MPSFIQDMSERMNSNRQANIAQKITKSVELMVANGDYKNIYNTEDFVDALSKYLKISKKCDSDHIADCWPTKTIKTANGSSYDVSNAKTSSDLYTGWVTTDNVGLVLADGASLIMTFNPKAETATMEGGFSATSKSLPIGGGKYKSFAYSSSATNAIDFVMDVNGGTGPNQEPDLKGNFYDIRSFRIATFTPQACQGGMRVNGYCLLEIGTNYDYYNCLTRPEGASYCKFNINLERDYYAGALKACQSLGMTLPTVNLLGTFASQWHVQGFDFNQYVTSSIESYTGKYHIGNSSGWVNIKNAVQYPVLCVKSDD